MNTESAKANNGVPVIRGRYVAAGILLADLSLAEMMLDRAEASFNARAVARTRENARRAHARVSQLLAACHLDKLRRMEIEDRLSELRFRLNGS